MPPQRDSRGRFVSSGTPFSGGRSAGNTIYIDLPNIGQVIGRIRQAGAGLVTQTDRITKRLADETAVVARDLVAKDERKVEASIRVEHRERGPVYTVVADRLGERDEVPIYLEIGTYKMAARPFMKPALDLVLSANGLQRAAASVGGLLPPMRTQGFGH